MKLLRLGLLMFLGVGLMAQSAPLSKGVNWYSEEKETQLGAARAEQVRQKTTAIKNQAVQDYIDGLGRQLAAQLPETPFPYTFEVVADRPAGDPVATHEPLAMPGGVIFVPASLIQAAKSEAELAGMLAHAMAHVSARHETRMATRQQILSMSTTSLANMGGPAGQLAQTGATMAAQTGTMKFQREFELQADQVAAQTMARAGYDPTALVAYIRRTEPPVATQPQAMSAMPGSTARIANLEETIKALPPATYSTDAGKLRSVQKELSAPRR
jgi:beta-barrel assembly-enhancing protease